ncbi:MAG: Mur ligase family protein [Candidatus Krumholzibacteriales bacterium]
MIVANHSRSSGRGRPFSNIEFLYSLRPTNMKLGLENITAVLDYLGNPQKRFPSVLVAGTNGKGSVSAYLTSILRVAGLKTGTFYSPHLFRINERIQVNGREIPSWVLDAYLGELRGIHSDCPFTFFEGVTAAAILHFVESEVDAAVFEVGLGGRLDATRLVSSILSVITGISIDHTRHLGSTREEILHEKLGVVKKGIPAVVNLESRPLISIAREFCGRAGSPIYNADAEAETELKSMRAEKMLFSLKTESYDYGDLESRIIGEHQLRNITTAVRSAEVLSGIMGVDLRRYISDGVGKAFLPGRFQVLSGRPRIIMDVSHNEQSLLGSISTLRAVSEPEHNIIVFGCMERKDLGSFPAKAEGSSRILLLAPLKGSGAAAGEDLAARFDLKGKAAGAAGTAPLLCAGMREALELALDSAERDDTLLVLGSHHAVEEALSFL